MCGDFQAVLFGEKKAPILTIFVGGNHEASNYLQELPYGGWVAPNIYYMGYAGVIQVGGVRIAGCSGIFKGHNAHKGHYEHPPYNEDAKRSAYHVRALEIFRLKQLTRPVKIFVSHDWPRNIWKYGDVHELLKRKPDFQKDIDDGRLGNPFHEELLYYLKPEYWFAAHLHIKFPAAVQHEASSILKCQSKVTKFLSLDKCLPRRKFLQVLDVPHDSDKPINIELDAEWLAILKSTNHLLNLKRADKYLPGPGGRERWNFNVTNEEMNSIIEDFGGSLTIPDNFEKSVDVYNPSERNPPTPQTMTNSQTTLLCTMLDLTDPNAVFLGKDSKYDTSMDGNVDENVGSDNDEDDDVDDDTEYESFVADSDQSLSFLSSNEKDNPAKSQNDSEEDSDEEFKAIMQKQKLEQSIDKSTSPSKSSASQSDLDDTDSELQEITAEQKAKRQLQLTSDRGHVELALPGSDDEELASLIAEQKKFQTVPDISVEETPSLVSEDTIPLSQSSPASSGERSDSEVVRATSGLVLGEDKEGRKRSDGSESEESPQSKKIRVKRNQSLYESGSEME
ncbi:DBR1 [Mytilus edulis]|uniref:DBR1 n=1 Tax=Mytilus edulis TaxID=6550 RepID=A0A8S3TW00_MYTED|nr:DBR1 [Mytilus edulis]